MVGVHHAAYEAPRRRPHHGWQIARMPQDPDNAPARAELLVHLYHLGVHRQRVAVSKPLHRLCPRYVVGIKRRNLRRKPLPLHALLAEVVVGRGRARSSRAAGIGAPARKLVPRIAIVMPPRILARQRRRRRHENTVPTTAAPRCKVHALNQPVSTARRVAPEENLRVWGCRICNCLVVLQIFAGVSD